ncbi:MAG: Zn-dependent exopeptidase M28 [Brevundimonas sp.]|nr:MAG: Zn-dependent exopeptidase M28 [Brevundimonas sp.]
MRLFHIAAALAPLLIAAQPASAQDPDLRAQVAALVQPTNAARTEAVMAQLRAAGFAPAIETFAGGGRGEPMEGRNVVAAFGPETGPEILLVAHYDAVVLQDGTLSQGVVDNGGSVVAMIEAAKRLKDRPLRHRIRILFTDQEELGLVGAKAWLAAHGKDGLAAVINSDVAAYGDTMMYGLNNGDQSAGVVRSLRLTCAAQALQCVGYPMYPPSDDRVFSAAGVPTVSVGFQDEIGAHQMWLLVNTPDHGGFTPETMPKVFRVIHSPGDRLEEADPAALARMGEVYAALVEQVDRDLP